MLKRFFDTEGPGGLPMQDRQAKALEQRLQSLPHDEPFGLRRLQLGRGASEVTVEGRTDVSWITEESPDRLDDVVLASGMDDSHFQLNPIVTLNHCYTQPPVGRSLWRRTVREGALVGVKAKTFFPPRPDSWSGVWMPDAAFDLVRAGLLLGKSIGFFPLKMRAPTPDEVARHPSWKNARHVVEEWLLAEYACCYLPMQPHAVVESVGKSLPLPGEVREALQLEAIDAPLSLDRLEKALRSEKFAKTLEKTLRLTLQSARGIV